MEILEINVNPNTEKMIYKYLGDSGLKVSAISLEVWLNHEDDVSTIKCFGEAIEQGINYFNISETRGLGKAEETLGKVFSYLKVPREKIVIGTRIYKIGDDPNDAFLSRKHIIEGIQNSLKRLKLEYVDILYCQGFDMNTPIEEICKSMNYCINKGYSLYWGISNWTSCQIMEACNICNNLGLIKPIVNQIQYNMLNRDKMEAEYRDLFKKYKFGSCVNSPLYSGILTGKYIKGILDDLDGKKKEELNNTQYFKNKNEWDIKLNKLEEIAKNKLNCTLSQLAIAWVIKNPDVSSCILSVSNDSELIENIKAIEVCNLLTKDILIEIENILSNAPIGEMDYLNWKEMPSRRNITLGIDYIKNKK